MTHWEYEGMEPASMSDRLINRILVVDDEKPYRELLAEILLTWGYTCEVAADAFEALDLLSQGRFDLVISDIRMQGKDGLELMREARETFPQLDFIIMTGYAPEYSYTDVISAGATDFICKPFQLTELEAKLGRIERENQNIRRLQVILEETLDALASALEMKDPYTAGHQRRVATLACAIAMEMGLSTAMIDTIRMAALVHDIGKLSVPAEILTKPTKLKETEVNLVKDHAQTTYDILSKVEFPWPIAQIGLQHHERVDGSGYPHGLSGTDILLEARIIAVADVVESMGTHRPYRAALGMDRTLEEITMNRGILYDAEVADACLKLFVEKGYKLD